MLLVYFIKLPLVTARAASCDGRVHLFVCLSPNCKNAIFSKTRQFRAMVSIDVVLEVVHGLFKEPIIGPLKFKMADIRHFGSWCQHAKMRFSQKLCNLKLWCLLMTYRKLCNWAFQRTHYWIHKINMAEIRHLENRHDVIFFCRGWSDLDKISETGAEWHVDCGDVVEIETRCRIPIWQTFGQIQWHVIPEPPATLQGAATWRIQCHDSRATCHIAGCCHRVNSVACHPRATYHIAGCYHLVNSLSQFQSHIPHSWRNQCHDRATLQGVRIPSAILKVVFRHILFFCF